MNDLKIKKYLYNQAPLRLLSFISNYPERMFLAHEISRTAQCSKGSTNQTLRFLLELGVLSRERKGNLFLYKLNPGSYLLRQFKIFENLLKIHQLVQEIQKYCYEIILFGSRAEGTNLEESDIDLFIVAEDKKKVRDVMRTYLPADVKYQIIIQDPLELASSKKDSQIFHNEVKKGITLWRGKPEYE